MDDSKYGDISEEEANKMLEEILDEDQQENDDTDVSQDCLADCAEDDSPVEKLRILSNFLMFLKSRRRRFTLQKICKCMRIAENSSRFSLRVMEAMRWAQKEEDGLLPTSSIEDIVDYFELNYRDDGDLYAQVRTALKQVCFQGFAVKLLENEYYFVGPDATSINRTSCSNDCGDCLQSVSLKPTKRKPRRDESEDVSCDCETLKPEQLISSRKHRKECDKTDDREEVADCSCSLTLTDETLEETGFLGRRGKLRKGSLKNNTGRKGLPGEGRSRTMEEKRLALTWPRGKDRTMENGRAIGNSEIMVDDVYQELEAQDTANKSKERKKELKRWIKRCKKQCEEQGKRRVMDD